MAFQTYTQRHLEAAVCVYFPLFFYILIFCISTGEPLWAETTRIIFQIILLFIFAVFLAFVIRQAVDSPNVTQTIEEATATVEIPGRTKKASNISLYTYSI